MPIASFAMPPDNSTSVAAAGKKAIAPVFSEDIGLRLLEEQDIEMLRAWRNRDDIRFFFKKSEIITAEQQVKWFARYRGKTDDYCFVVLWNSGQETHRPVGIVSLYSIADGKAEYGRCMIGDEDARGQGVMLGASRLLLEIARKQLGLTELCLEVFNANAHAVRLYQKLAFRQVSRDNVYTYMRIYL